MSVTNVIGPRRGMRSFQTMDQTVMFSLYPGFNAGPWHGVDRSQMIYALQEGGSGRSAYFTQGAMPSFQTMALVSPGLKAKLKPWILPLGLAGGAAALYGVSARNAQAKKFGIGAIAGSLAAGALVASSL